MNRDLLKQRLIKHERTVGHAYQDSLGYWTIGTGHLIDERKGGSLPPHILDLLLEYDMDCAAAELDKGLPWWREQPESVQTALAEMVFQMGLPHLLSFKHGLTALAARQYAEARYAFLDSLWARQTPQRAGEVVALLQDTPT